MIRLKLSFAVVALTVWGVAAPALAQQTPPTSPPPFSRPPAELDRHMANIRHAQMAEFEAFRDTGTGYNLGPQSLERIDLANRVSTLIALGRCADARTMASEAGERVMALRARQLCRPARDRTVQSN